MKASIVIATLLLLCAGLFSFAQMTPGKEITTGAVTYQVIVVPEFALIGIPTDTDGANTRIEVFLRTTDHRTTAYRVTLTTTSGVQRQIVEPWSMTGYWQASAGFTIQGQPTAITLEELASVSTTHSLLSK